MKAQIRALIVDDEALGRKNLQFAIEEHSNWLIAAQASSVAQARIALATQEIDIIFLDIQMPRETGLQLARELCQQATPPLIIFVTAFDEHAVAAFELHALDYLLKPLNDVRLVDALRRAESMLELKQQAEYSKALHRYMDDDTRVAGASTPNYWSQVSIRSIGKIETVALSEVLWIEAQGNYMQLHTSVRQMLYRASMATLEKHLDPSIFLRVHRSAIVRKDQIVRLMLDADKNYQLVLRNGDELLVSERYVATVKEFMARNIV